MNDISKLLNQAYQFYKAGDMDNAATLYRQALDIDANNVPALTNLGIIYLEKSDYEESAYWLKRTLALDPASVTANSNLGLILLKCGKYLEAAEHLLAAIRKAPGRAYLWNDLGDALLKSGQAAGAAECYQKAVKINPKYIDGYLKLGEIAAKDAFSIEKAIGYYTKALSIDENNATAHYELSRIYYLETCQFEKAIGHVQKALSIKPDFDEAKVTLAELLLMQGKLSEGFPLFDQSRHLYIDKESERYKFFQMVPRWHGEIFTGKRLIIGEDGGFGGFGDMLLFARYIPLVKQKGGQVVLPIKKQLYRLMKSLGGVDEFLLPSEEPIWPKDFDLQIPFVSLPVIFKTSLDTIPPAPYLAADPKLTAIWKNRVESAASSDNSLKVGLAWACNPHKDGNPEHRTCSFQTLTPLFQLPHITYYNLQIGDAALEMSAHGESAIIDLTGQIEDFADTAALINNLDLVVSVDTAVAHLAGAIGKPVWLMLSFISVWYWLTNRTDSPWYPTMRLFRSSTPGGFSEAVAEVCKHLQKVSQNRDLLLNKN